MKESFNSVHAELLPNTSLGADFLPLNNRKNNLESNNEIMGKKMNTQDKVAFSSSSSFCSHKDEKIELSSSDTISSHSSKKSSDQIRPKKLGRDKDEIKKEIQEIGKKVSKNKNLHSSEHVPDDLRAQFELAVNKVRAYIEKEYIDRMCEIDSENAIKLQRELNKILQSERDALEREKYNFEKRLREEMEREMHATIEVAAVENKKKADISLAEVRKDIEAHYISRQKEVEKDLYDRKKEFESDYAKRRELLEQELLKRREELEEEFSNKKKEYLENLDKRKKELESDFEDRKNSIERIYEEKLNTIKSQFEENLKLRLEVELAKYDTKQQSNIIEKEKEFLQGKVLVDSLKEQLEKITIQKNELENMSSTTINSMKSYLKELEDSSSLQKTQIGTMEKTIKALYMKEQETMELVNKANEKMSKMIDLKEAKKIAYNSLLKGKATQLFDETLRIHFRNNYLKRGFDELKRQITRPKIVSMNGDGRGLKGNDLTLFLIRKEQLSLMAENENLMNEVENLKVKHIEELKKTQESFMMYKKELEKDSSKETNIALYETSMLKFAYIFKSKVRLQLLDAFWRIIYHSNKSSIDKEEPRKELTSRPIDINSRDKFLIYFLNSLFYRSKLKLLSYSWRKLVFQAKFSSYKTLPTTPFKDIGNYGGTTIDSFHLRDFLSIIGKDSVTSFAHQPNYYNKLPSVVNIQNKPVFVPLRRDNPINYGTYFQYNKDILSESCVTGKPVGSFTSSNFN